MATKAKKPTYAQLARQNAELIAQLVVVHKLALQQIHKATTDKCMGSGVMVQLTGVGGGEIIQPVMIRDGLSEETVLALSKDITRSMQLTMSGV